MKNITHTSGQKKVVMALIASMSLGLLLTGCMHQPVVKPLAGVSPQEPQAEAIAYCKTKTTLSLKEKLDLINQSGDTFGDAGRGAGSVSDLVRKTNGTGAEAGESIGKTIGMIGAIGALYKNAQAEDQHFQVCMKEKGYMVARF
jgi:hypothetical protein